LRSQRIILLLIFAVGFALLSVSFKRSQFPKDLPHQQSDNTLNDRERVYLDRHTELNKWLIGLAYAILTALVSKRVADPNEPRLNSFACSLGAILLLLSLYAGFLSHQSILIVMSSRPLNYIGSALTAYPLAAQMLLLIAATTILVYALLRPSALKCVERSSPR
jgi:hypothetical protein